MSDRSSEVIAEMVRALRNIEATLPHLGGSERGTDALMRDIRAAIARGMEVGGIIENLCTHCGERAPGFQTLCEACDQRRWDEREPEAFQ